MNSYVQALFMTKIFRYRILSLQLANKPQTTTEKSELAVKDQLSNTNDNKIDLNEESKTETQQKSQSNLNLHLERRKLLFLFQTQKLFAYLYQSEREYINAAFFRAVLPDPFSTTYAQQDSSEFGSRYLDQIENSLRNAEDKVSELRFYLYQYRK